MEASSVKCVLHGKKTLTFHAIVNMSPLQAVHPICVLVPRHIS